MKFSISSVKCFKACPRMYKLKYVEGLEPIKQAEALETGKTYHSKLEELYKNGCVDVSDLSKESAMATAYQKYIYPEFKVRQAEEWVQYELIDDDILVGRVDGIAEDGSIVEHKTTGAEIGEEYEYNLQWDEQILAYMLMTGARKVWYTVCRKPTIRQKKNESEEEFFQRMVDWYDEDTESKIRLFEIYRTDEEVNQFEKDLKETADVMSFAFEVKSLGRDLYYRNTCQCNMWGRRCEYSSVCLNYDPIQEYVEFERKERRDENGN